MHRLGAAGGWGAGAVDSAVRPGRYHERPMPAPDSLAPAPELSGRRLLFGRIDTLTDEMVRRYRADEANVNTVSGQR